MKLAEGVVLDALTKQMEEIFGPRQRARQSGRSYVAGVIVSLMHEELGGGGEAW